MKLVKRNGIFVRLPGVVLGLLILNLVWDIIKINLNSEFVKRWPWRFTLLDISTCAALAGIVAGLLLTRAQFSMSVRPAVGWSGHEAKSNLLADAAWTVHLTNHGPGRCRISKVEYSYTLTDKLPSDWKTWDMIIGELTEAGILINRDYHLEDNGVGFTIPVTSGRAQETELAAFTRRCLTRLSALDIALEVDDVIGDTYARTINVLHGAQRAIEFKGAHSAKTNLFRRKPQI
jgi:hypothetical protein